MYKLKPVTIHGNQKIKRILDDGFCHFEKDIHEYCNEYGSKDTILSWGTQKSYLSLFSHGLAKRNRICFLEASFTRTFKIKGKKGVRKSKKIEKAGLVDAFLIDRSNEDETLSAIIEAKKIDPWVCDIPSKGNLKSPINALEEAKKQLEEIDPKTICMDEENKSIDHTYRIAMVFTIVRIKFALSGKGSNLEWDKFKNIKNKAVNYFKDIRNNMDEDHISI